jgi:hypothetical protein
MASHLQGYFRSFSLRYVPAVLIYGLVCVPRKDIETSSSVTSLTRELRL